MPDKPPSRYGHDRAELSARPKGNRTDDMMKALQNAHEFLMFYFCGPDAEMHRAVEGIENMKAEAAVAVMVAEMAMEAPVPDPTRLKKERVV